MSQITLSGNASGTGVFTIASPNSNSNYTQTLPAATGTLYIPGTTVSNIQSGTAVASTSGTSIDFTSIPSWVKRITVMFGGVSTSGTSNIIARIGSGSIDSTSTYTGAGSYVGGTNNCGATQNTTSFILVGTSTTIAASTYCGALTFTTLGSNIWCLTGTLSSTSSTIYNHVSSGNKTLSGTLDRVSITTVNGTDTFDAGTINIFYE